MFRNLNEYLKTIVKVVKDLDPNARVCLFGSVAEGRNLYSSDIDVLVLTNLKPEIVISELWEHGIEDPFEIHVRKPGDIEIYRRRARLTELL